MVNGLYSFLTINPVNVEKNEKKDWLQVEQNWRLLN